MIALAGVTYDGVTQPWPMVTADGAIRESCLCPLLLAADARGITHELDVIVLSP